MDSLTDTVVKWLKLLGVPVDKNYAIERLSTHPDFPSALCITSFLEELEIPSSVLKLDSDDLADLQHPFLAFIDGETFMLLATPRHVNTIPQFEHRWDNIVIVAEPSQAKITRVHRQALQRTQAKRYQYYLASVAIAILIVNHALSQALFRAAMGALSVIGLVVGILLTLKATGYKVKVVEGICDAVQASGCDKILNDHLSIAGIQLSDLVVIFFSGSTLLCGVVPLFTPEATATTFSILLILSLSAVPFILFSIYYQIRKSSWCSLCLFVDAILASMAWIGLLTIKVEFQHVFVAPAVAIFVLPGIFWLLIKNVTTRFRMVHREKLELQNFKRNPNLFAHQLSMQPKIEIEIDDLDFVIGTKNAGCEIMLVGSFSCVFCQEAFDYCISLLEKRPNEVSLCVRFFFDVTKPDDDKTLVYRHMLRYWLERKNDAGSEPTIISVIAEWYRLRDKKKFIALHPITAETNVDVILKKRAQWLRSTKLSEAPSILINGHVLQRPYTYADLQDFEDVLIHGLTEIQRQQ